MTTHVHTAAGTGDQCVDLRDPYPFFAQKRAESGVFHGTVMDYSKTPESLRPERKRLGLQLARLETRGALDCLLSRLSNVTLVTDGDPHIHGQPFRSPTALPVTFDAN